MSLLHTKRLLLRPIYPEDVDDVFEYSCSADVGPNAGWRPHESKEETLEIMQAIFLGKDGIWGIVLKETNKLIGSIGLIRDPKRENERARMVGYSLGEQYWGRKIMSEAAGETVRFGFEDLRLDLVSAYCYPFNQRSKGVLKKCGFRYEGRLKMAEKRYDGKIFDNECYAITAEEYFATRS